MESTPEEKQSREVHILIVDDDERMAKTIARALQAQGYTCQIALSGDQGLNYVHDQHFDLILTDLVMPGFDGVTFVRSVKAIDPNIPSIMITGHGTIDSAVESMKAGAFHYLTKPIRLQDLQVYVNKALDSREMLVEVQELKDRLKNFDRGHRIIGKSQGIRNIITQVEQIAPSTATVLITGETGTGKEIIAETIHLLSPRAHKNMIKVNCGALPESLLESELFGHTKGSFTGHTKTIRGVLKWRTAARFSLDEIGDDPASTGTPAAGIAGGRI